MAHDWNEMVTINLPKNGDLVTKVTVNGRTYEIERGKPTEVPYPVYERLQLMLAWDQTPPAKVPRLTWADLGESKTEETLLPETVINFGGKDQPVPLDVDGTKIKAGDNLTVTYDGVSYPVIVADLSAMQEGAYAFGNTELLVEGSGNGEPFFVVGVEGNVFANPLAEDYADHTIAIQSVVAQYNPIPAEYLPAGVGGGTTIFVFDDHRMCDMDTGNAISADEFYVAVDKGPIYVLRNGEYMLAAIYAPNGDGVEVKLWTGSSGYVAVYTKEVELSS